MKQLCTIIGLSVALGLLLSGCRTAPPLAPPGEPHEPIASSQSPPPAEPLPAPQTDAAPQTEAAPPTKAAPTQPPAAHPADEPDAPPVQIDSSAEAKLLQLIETTDDPVVKRALAAQLSAATVHGSARKDPPIRVAPGGQDHAVQNAAPSGADSQSPADSSSPEPPHGSGPLERPPRATENNPQGGSGPAGTPNESAAAGRQPVSADEYLAADRPPVEAPAAATAEEQVKPGHWKRLLEETIRSLEHQLRSGPDAEPGDEAEAEREALLRLLYLVADDREKAVQSIEQFDEEEGEFWKELVYGLMVYFNEQEMPLRQRRMTLALQHLRRAADYLSMISDLEVRNVVFCTRVDSYGRYTRFKKYQFRPDQEVLLYVEVENFTVQQRSSDGQYETALQGSYEIRDLAQQKVAEHSFLLEKEVCRNRRRDFFIPYRMYMPKIRPGQYTLQVTIQDAKSKRIGQSAPVAFTIRR